jgi:hypothetical protein
MCPFADYLDKLFLEQVASWIEVRLAQRPYSFGSLIACLPGVDPLTVATALDAIGQRGGELGRTAAALLQQAADTPATDVSTSERPLPHPLEFYWAYTQEAIEALLLELASSAGRGATIAYLGAPNLFRVATERLPDRAHVLLERNAQRLAALGGGPGRVVRLDLLRDELPALRADAAVLDPPWYPDHIRGFLWAATEVAHVGADIWASFPPAGTRPTIEQEMAEVLGSAANFGLEVLERRRDVLRYSSPPFELASHRAAGLGGIPLNWRTADLVHLRVKRASIDSRRPAPADEYLWLPFVIDDVPVWVRERSMDQVAIGSGLLQPLIEGDVLPSVSRRDPSRGRVDVWTSLNRVWSSSHPRAIQGICRALAERSDPLTAVESDLSRTLSSQEREHVQRVADQVRNVIRLERQEHGLGSP